MEGSLRKRADALARIVRRLMPSAEGFAAAAAVYGPDLMLQLAATSRTHTNRKDAHGDDDANVR